MTTSYGLSPDLVVERRSSFYLIGGGADAKLYLANEPAMDLLRRFDGVTPLSRILESSSADDAPALRRAARDAIAGMTRHEVLVPSSPQTGSRASSRRFDHLFLEMTSRCNLRCKHCYMEGGLARQSELKLQDWLDLVEEFASGGGRYLTLSGGESLMYPGWAVLGGFARERGLELSLMTNGSYLDAAALETIMDLGAAVGLGLDGVKADTHDLNRGRGSFEQAMSALSLIVEHEYQQNTSFCFTPMKFNVYDLPALIDLAVESGVPRLYVSLLEERGRAEFFSDKLALTEAQREWVIPYLYDAATRLDGTLFIEVTHHVEIFHRLRYGLDASKAPQGTIRVTSDGEVYLSAYMGAPDHCVGHVGEGRLADMLRSSKTHAILEAFAERAEKIDRCRKCVFRGVCGGGVAVLAHSKFDDFYVPDEYCEPRIALFERVVQERALAAGLA